MLTVLTPASSTALLTLAQVKDRLGITVATHDTTLTALIAAVSEAAARVIAGAGPGGARRAIVAQQYRALLPGSGRLRLILPRRPIDPSTVSVTLDGTALVLDEDYSIDSAAQGLLYRSSLWPVSDYRPGEEGELDIQVDFWAGYVPPTAAYTWSATTARAVGDWILPTNLATSPLRFRVKEVAGSSQTGASEPDWSAQVAGDEVTDGDLTLVAHELPDAPEDLLLGAHFAVQTWFRAAPLFAGVAADQLGPHRIEYHRNAEVFADALPAPTLSLWQGLAA